MQSQLEKAINLSKKTGDRVIVVDKYNENDIFVVMSLDEYEKIISQGLNRNSETRGLTEGELIDKINRDIANWKSDQRDLNNNLEFDDFYSEDSGDNESDIEDDNLYYYGEEDDGVGISDIMNEDYDFSFKDSDKDSGKEEDLEKYEDKHESDIKSVKDIVEDRYNFDFQDENKKGDSLVSPAQERKVKKSLWKIPSSVKKGAEEVI